MGEETLAAAIAALPPEDDKPKACPKARDEIQDEHEPLCRKASVPVYRVRGAAGLIMQGVPTSPQPARAPRCTRRTVE